jgi:hypothetical protein
MNTTIGGQLHQVSTRTSFIYSVNYATKWRDPYVYLRLRDQPSSLPLQRYGMTNLQSSSTANSPVFVNDASTATLSPLLTPPNSSDSELAQSSVDCSIISRRDHAQKRELDSIESDSKQEGKRRDVSVQNDFICEECRQIEFQKVLDLNADTLQETRNSRGVFMRILLHDAANLLNTAVSCAECSPRVAFLCTRIKNMHDINFGLILS